MKNVCLNGGTLSKLIDKTIPYQLIIRLDIDTIKLLKFIGFQPLNGVFKKSFVFT